MVTETNDPRRGTSGETLDHVGRRLLRGTLMLVAAVAVLAAAISCVVQVDETEYVIVERLGEITAVYDRPADRGLHFKLPWPIETVRRFDRREQLFDPPGREVFTSDKKNVIVDAYVRWKIATPTDEAGADPAGRPVVKFFRGLGSVDVAEARLDSRVRSILGTRIGQVELGRLLQAEASEAGPADGEGTLLRQLSDDVRRELVRRDRERESVAERLGLEIVDVRVKRLNLPAGNQQAVFERMRSERKKIADQYRGAGMADNQVIRSEADRQYQAILAKARADAERIRGEAEAKSISILNEAHARDPEFYAVMRTLDTYRTIVNEKTTLVLSASSNLLKLLTEGLPDVQDAGSDESSPPSKTQDDPPEVTGAGDDTSGTEGEP